MPTISTLCAMAITTIAPVASIGALAATGLGGVESIVLRAAVASVEVVTSSATFGTLFAFASFIVGECSSSAFKFLGSRRSDGLSGFDINRLGLWLLLGFILRNIRSGGLVVFLGSLRGDIRFCWVFQGILFILELLQFLLFHLLLFLLELLKLLVESVVVNMTPLRLGLRSGLRSRGGIGSMRLVIVEDRAGPGS